MGARPCVLPVIHRRPRWMRSKASQAGGGWPAWSRWPSVPSASRLWEAYPTRKASTEARVHDASHPGGLSHHESQRMGVVGLVYALASEALHPATSNRPTHGRAICQQGKQRWRSPRGPGASRLPGHREARDGCQSLLVLVPTATYTFYVVPYLATCLLTVRNRRVCPRCFLRRLPDCYLPGRDPTARAMAVRQFKTTMDPEFSSRPAPAAHHPRQAGVSGPAVPFRGWSQRGETENNQSDYGSERRPGMRGAEGGKVATKTSQSARQSQYSTRGDPFCKSGLSVRYLQPTSECSDKYLTYLHPIVVVPQFPLIRGHADKRGFGSWNGGFPMLVKLSGSSRCSRPGQGSPVDGDKRTAAQRG